MGSLSFDRRQLLALSAAGFVSAAQADAAPRRVALVIGNSAYPSPGELPNAARDARAMANALKSLGFRVHLLIDANLATMNGAIAAVGDDLRGGKGVGWLFFAGHGIQARWRNYMLPVDIRAESSDDLTRNAVAVSEVLDVFAAAKTRLNVLVLDACRDNPFGKQLPTSGLADILAPEGTLIALATAAGNLALDGETAGHSPYTQALLSELQDPNRPLEDLFRRVRLRVREQTEGRQIPWVSSSLAEEFRLGAGFVPAPALTYEAQLSRFTAEKLDWDLIKQSESLPDFYAYLRKYPNGFMAEFAQFRLDQLQLPRVTQAPDANGTLALMSGKWRYLTGDVLEWEIYEFQTLARRQVNRVTAASAILVEVNDGSVLWDQLGGIVRNRFGSKEPAVLFVPAELRIGRRWRSAFRNTSPNERRSTDLWESRAVALEKIDVPAGSFWTIRVERKGESRPDESGITTRMEGTLWVHPETMQWVRNDLRAYRLGAMVVDESWRLARWVRTPRA